MIIRAKHSAKAHQTLGCKLGPERWIRGAKGLAAKPDGMSSIPRTGMEGQNRLSQAILCA